MLRTKLSVNLNKVALLRNSREGNWPDPVFFGRIALEAAAPPPHPPIKAEHKSSTGKKSGQRAMLSVVNPAVVAIDTTWKNAWLIVISAEL